MALETIWPLLPIHVHIICTTYKLTTRLGRGSQARRSCSKARGRGLSRWRGRPADESGCWGADILIWMQNLTSVDSIFWFSFTLQWKKKTNHVFSARLLFREESSLSCWDVEGLEKGGWHPWGWGGEHWSNLRTIMSIRCCFDGE